MLQVKRVFELLRLKFRTLLHRKPTGSETFSMDVPKPSHRQLKEISNRTRRHRYHVYKYGTHILDGQHFGTFSPVRPFRSNGRILP
jgi:hypothetical protein